MRIVSTKIIRDYYEKHPDSQGALLYWVEIVKRANWSNFADIKADFNSVDYVGNQRYIFNIGGNKHRLVAVVQFVHQHLYIRFIGTHKEYDKIDCKNI